MAQFRRGNPYDPGYALPQHVLAEPPGRGTFVTAVSNRRNYDIPEHIPDGGYALPEYIRNEPHGQNARSTWQIPRKHADGFIPGDLGNVFVDAFKQNPAAAITGAALGVLTNAAIGAAVAFLIGRNKKAAFGGALVGAGSSVAAVAVGVPYVSYGGLVGAAIIGYMKK